jgi:NAD(P)-dependent dehydrogenase (short-subunit alcohol dehydrogenase family)
MKAEDWAGGVAVITGAGSGIGAGIARAAALAGMTVVVTDIASARAIAVAEEIVAAGGRAEPITIDVTDEQLVRALCDRVYRDIGEVRMLVNNAGIMNFGPSWELTTKQWRNVLDVNVMGVLHGITAFLPKMVESARRGKRSALVNIASLASIAALPMSTAYVMSKHAVLALSECLSLELTMEQLPIDVSVVLPGNINTQIYEGSILSNGATDTGARIKKLLTGMASHHGMSPNQAGQIIFDKVRAREFWVATDPELTQQTVAGRVEFLRAPTRPQLPPAMVDALRALKST